MRRKSLETLNNDYGRYIWRKWLVLLVLLVITAASGLFSLIAGSAGLSVKEVVLAIAHRGDLRTETIIWNVRMPKLTTAAAVGAALALSGCIMQNVLRNPLASSSTLGVSQGASFGAAVAIVYFGAGIQVNAGGTSSALTVTNPALVTLCAFAGGMATTVVILAISRLRGTTPATMVLVGVALSSMFTGGTALIQYFCDDVMVATVVYWTFGSLGRAGWRDIAIIVVLTFGAVLAVSPAARAAVSRWLRQMTTAVTAYRFPAEQSAGTWTGNGPTWLPEGYVMDSDFTGGDGVRTVRYTSQQGDVLLAAVGFRSDRTVSMEVRSHRTAGLSDILTGQRPQGEPGEPEGYDITEVQVQGRDAQLYRFHHLPDERAASVYSVLFYLDGGWAPFYQVAIPEQGRLLVWVDEDAGQVFLLFGTPGQEALCRMAESMYEERSNA